MSKVTITIERLGDIAQMQIARENQDPIVINIESYSEDRETAGDVSVAVMTGNEVPFE